MISLRSLFFCSLFAFPLVAFGDGHSCDHHHHHNKKDNGGNWGGFSGPHITLNSVKEVLETPASSDGRAVQLTGFVSEALGRRLYTFHDETGSIAVQISRSDWGGLRISPETRVTLVGAIRSRRREVNASPRVDVASLRLAGQEA
ncbi:MAG: NirD/YgiW/YdeI family stress tolerance protein [Kistimonas sp.]|nr:NirD/YgiW/YdeI family stress tolerance protein [Kistimonas sp.]